MTFQFRFLASFAALSFACLACESSMVDSGDGADGTGGVVDSGTGGSAAGGGSTGGGSATGGTSGGEDCPSSFVSLTYDDSLGSQLSNAVPALKTHGLVATFFLTQTSQAWGALLADGHELASHTVVHPCPKATYLNAGNNSEDFDLTRMATELDTSKANVLALGATEPMAFAYPCGVNTVGEDKASYVPLVQPRFSGARGVVGSVITTLADPFNVPAYFSKATGAVLIGIADSAAAQGGWVVFGFHGIGGDYEEVSLDAHEALLAHLDEQDIPVRTFSQGLACKQK